MDFIITAGVLAITFLLSFILVAVAFTAMNKDMNEYGVEWINRSLQWLFASALFGFVGALVINYF